MALDSLARPVKKAIAREVVGLFNDRSRGEAPVPRRADGWFGPDSVAWRVHGDVAGMMVGGIAGADAANVAPGRAGGGMGPLALPRWT